MIPLGWPTDGTASRKGRDCMAESDFWQALSDTIHRSVNLRIVTVMGDAVISGTLERLEIGAPWRPRERS